MIEFQAGNPLAVGQHGGCGERAELAPIDERLENILLDIQVVVDDGSHLLAQRGKMLDGFLDAVVGDVVGGGLGTQGEMVADVLLGKPMTVMGANDRIGQVEILDHGLELAPIVFGDPAAKDHGQFRRLANRAIGIEEALAESVQGRPAAEDEIVAVFHLCEEEAMLTSMLPLAWLKKRREGRQPLLTATLQVVRREGIGHFLQASRIAAAEEGVRTLPERDALGPQFVRDPVMLIQADACGEGKVRTHADEQATPRAVVDVKVVVHHPALGELQMPSVLGLLADGDQDPRRFACLEDRDDPIWLGLPEIRFDELVTILRRRIQNGSAPAHRPVLDPVMELVGNVAQKIPTHRILVAARAEKANHAFGLLEWLNEPVEQHPIETPVCKANAILVMLVEGVHLLLQGGQRPRRIKPDASTSCPSCARSAPKSRGLCPFRFSRIIGISRAEPLAIKNRDRLLDGDIARAFFVEVRTEARAAGWLSDEHFTVDGTLLEAWAGQKSFRRKDGTDPPPDDPTSRNPTVDFRGEPRANDTHHSTTDSDARLYKKGKGHEAKLAYLGHVLTENRHGLIVDALVTHATGTAEREAAVALIADTPDTGRVTVGGDNNYDTKDFVRQLREMGVTPHVAQYPDTATRGSAIDTRTTRHPGYLVSQRKRKLVEQCFGWMKTVAMPSSR